MWFGANCAVLFININMICENLLTNAAPHGMVRICRPDRERYEGAIAAKTVTYDFVRLKDGAKLLKCSEFGDAMIEHM